MFPSQTKLLAALGERLRLARLRRRIGIDLMCERARVSRMTLYRIEEGSAAVSLGMYLNVLAVLHLESDLALLARDDAIGRMLQDQALPPRRRGPAKPPQREPVFGESTGESAGESAGELAGTPSAKPAPS